MFDILAFFFCAYGIGMLPLSYWYGKYRYNQEIEDYGPGSIGPIKLLRIVGPQGMIIAGTAEGAKGFLVAFIGYLLHIEALYLWCALLLLMIGHGWSPLLQGRGGNSWLPFSGYLFLIEPSLAQLSLALALSILLLTRLPSLGATISVFLTSLIVPFWSIGLELILILWIATMILLLQNWLVYNHRLDSSKI
ncbi:glycerol-3-phosphate acyltransferase [Heliorestis convoluta]|uniref:Membrane protein, putative n=1 Tax=Heliorestis convoluta TaxID=356322 RepID=A0A5Q2N004_9FIRM|nr:glycerol-3-phosphate acyltransferase [Heliorestis convoluta]QGG48257.1 Membrane protein, putative [Heliorestis convoluta]